MKSKIHFATDLDMVLADSTPVWLYGLYVKYGYFTLKNYKIKVSGVCQEEISKFIYERLLLRSNRIQPIKSSINALPKILEFFNQKYIPIITSRNKNLFNCTKEWCYNNLTVPFQLFFTDGIDADKLKIILENDIHYFVDDRFKTANDIAPFIKTSFLINYEWNFDRDVHPNVIRQNNLTQVLKHLKDKLINE